MGKGGATRHVARTWTVSRLLAAVAETVACQMPGPLAPVTHVRRLAALAYFVPHPVAPIATHYKATSFSPEPVPCPAHTYRDDLLRLHKCPCRGLDLAAHHLHLQDTRERSGPSCDNCNTRSSFTPASTSTATSLALSLYLTHTLSRSLAVADNT